MSSFFTIPGDKKKRKRQIAPDAPKKRIAGSKPPSKSGGAGSTSTSKNPKASARKSRQERDESLSGSDSDDGVVDNEGDIDIRDAENDSSSDSEEETAAEKRLRLAERYLDNVRNEVDTIGFDAAEIDRDLIAERLIEDVAESKGKVYRSLVPELDFTHASHTFFRADSKAVTSVTMCFPYAYMVTKDLAVQKWRLQELPGNQYPQTTKRKPKRQAPPKKRPELEQWIRGNFKKMEDKEYNRHSRDVLATAVSTDGKFLVTGGADKRLIIYDAETLRPLKVFTHHRDAVTGVAFRRGTHQLYSCSKDRTVKVWSLDEMAYVETLFGHGDEVVDIDALAQEKCISVGARDRTARLWKVADETQLVYRGGVVDKKAFPGVKANQIPQEGSTDRVAMIDDELFVTGSNNGSISLWNITKKKPIHTVSVAHGYCDLIPAALATAEKNPKPNSEPAPVPRWITALKTLPYSDVVLSGSWDGSIRVWQLSEDKRQLLPAGCLGSSTIEPSGPGAVDDKDSWLVPGIVNDIAVLERGDKGKDGLCVVAAIAKEHRLGRWINQAGGKNGGVVFEISRTRPAAVVEEPTDGILAADESE